MTIAEGTGSSIAGTIDTSQATTISLCLTSEEFMAYSSWRELLHFWGWQLRKERSHSGEYFLALPTFQGRLLDANDFRAFLRQLLGTNGQPEIPHSIQQILASVACRGAIMFGDRLDFQQGQRLVDSLQATQLCFQCAHGRPTMIPLIDLARSRSGASSRQEHVPARKSAMEVHALRAKLLRLCCPSSSIH